MCVSGGRRTGSRGVDAVPIGVGSHASVGTTLRRSRLLRPRYCLLQVLHPGQKGEHLPPQNTMPTLEKGRNDQPLYLIKMTFKRRLQGSHVLCFFFRQSHESTRVIRDACCRSKEGWQEVRRQGQEGQECRPQAHQGGVCSSLLHQFAASCAYLLRFDVKPIPSAPVSNVLGPGRQPAGHIARSWKHRTWTLNAVAACWRG